LLLLFFQRWCKIKNAENKTFYKNERFFKVNSKVKFLGGIMGTKKKQKKKKIRKHKLRKLRKKMRHKKKK